MVKLTSMVKTSGCAAKLAPAVLHSVIDSLPKMTNENLLEGFEDADDALVYKIQDDLACIQTVDFFPPMVDDPFVFGQIAATNALSDIYAMGSEPKVCMNVMAFPSCLNPDVMRQVLLGGQSKVKEANAIIAGGHTIANQTPLYGLCVTAFEKIDKIWKNDSAQVNDVLVLTKAIGVGILNTAIKAEFASQTQIDETIASMTTLNKRARDVARELEVHAATDITGFSLLGHAQEMARASNLSVELDFSSIPFLDGALEFARLGLLPEGAYNNMEYLGAKVEVSNNLEQNQKDVLFDPQTSGGLLLSLSETDALKLVSVLGNPASIIGRVFKKREKDVYVKL